jgi:O-antigen/teichoic acid export membrane protein
MLIYAGPILHLWIGERYVASGAPLLAALIVANIIRLIGLPYAIILVAAGQQSYIKVSPLSEGFSNLIASVILGSLYGGIGVAMGTLCGAVVSLAAHLWYSMPRTRNAMEFSRREYLLSGVLAPLACVLPLILAAAAVSRGVQIRSSVLVGAFVLSLLLAVFLVLGKHDESAIFGKKQPQD